MYSGNINILVFWGYIFNTFILSKKGIMNFKICAILLITAIIMSCDAKPDRPAPILDTSRIQAANQAAASVAGAAISGVQHYFCANNCEGSGGDAAGACPVCGTEYSHNQAWHDQQPAPAPTITTSGNTPGAAGALPPTNAVPEPAQNAAGVWHYTCPSGHAGGAGSAIGCSVCGTTLVHNQDYH